MITQDLDILARTIYGEARGEYGRLDGGLAALIAVGNVVINRFKQQTWFGKTISDVCLKPQQFSCWNESDPNYAILKSTAISQPVFLICQDVAQGVVQENWPDLTRGSDHYHTTDVKPAWAHDKKPIIQIGRHLFYRDC